jgi:predicted Zn-dependent protease
MRPMPLAHLEIGGIARCLAQVAEQPRDHVDAFFEVSIESRAAGALGQLTAERRFERGLAVRLLREGRTWLASSDEISPQLLARAIARVARARPGAVVPPPRSLEAGTVEPTDPSELGEFAGAVEAAIQRRHAAFAILWDLRAHQHWTRVVGAMLSPGQQRESYYSCGARTPWGTWGALLRRLDDAAVETVAESLTCAFRAQKAPAPVAGRSAVVLAPAAAAVLLHEAVAHALETDTLALSGDPEAAVGVPLAAPVVDVVDNPAGAGEGVRRDVDDEGMPVIRRWLLRGGKVEQPLADLFVASRSNRLAPGAARRGNRHLAPVPRSTHLELLPGSAGRDELIESCGEGLLVAEFSSGALDPLSGELRLAFPYARRIEGGQPAALVGPGTVRGSVVATLAAVLEVASDAAPGGAGWCAKGGHRLPVWATAASMLLESVEVAS